MFIAVILHYDYILASFSNYDRFLAWSAYVIDVWKQKNINYGYIVDMYIISTRHNYYIWHITGVQLTPFSIFCDFCMNIPVKDPFVDSFMIVVFFK